MKPAIATRAPSSDRRPDLARIGVGAGSGAVLGVCSGDPHLWLAGLAALTGMAWSVVTDVRHRGHGASAALLCSVACWRATGYGWVALTVHSTSADAPVWRVVVVALPVALDLAWTGLVWTGLQRHARRGPRTRIGGDLETALMWCLSFAAVDVLRQCGPLGNAYGGLATVFIDAPRVIAWLPLIGAQGVGVMACVVSATVVLFLLVLCGLRGTELRQRRVALQTSAGMALCLFGGAGLIAAVPERQWTRARADALTLVALQPALDKTSAWSTEQRDRAVNFLLDAVDHATPDSVLVTPETYFAESPPAANDGIWADLRQRVALRGVHVLIGMPGVARDEDGVHLMNTVLQLSPQRTALYAKERLVPGGEYLPWPELLQPLYTAIFKDVTLGQKSAAPDLTRPLYAAGAEVGLSICHELSFALTMADRARDAQWLVTLSEDGWIDSPSYRAQMLSLARLRAAEFGKPLLRVTHGGETALVSAQGLVSVKATSLGEQRLTFTVTPHDGQTPYGKFAGILAMTPILIWLVTAFLLALATRSRITRSQEALS